MRTCRPGGDRRGCATNERTQSIGQRQDERAGADGYDSYDLHLVRHRLDFGVDTTTACQGRRSTIVSDVGGTKPGGCGENGS